MGVQHARKISVKEGVNLYGVHPDLLRMAHAFMDALWAVAGVRCVITSAWDRDHSKNSYHDCGFAIDVRSKEVPTLDQKLDVLRRVRSQFPRPEYDVLLEAIDAPNEHYHGEKNAAREERDQWVGKVFGHAP